MKKFLTAILIATFISSSAFAQNVNIDLGKIDPVVAKQILTEQQRVKDNEARAAKIDVPTVPSPTAAVENLEKWTNVGKSLAEGVAATARGLSIEANEFVKTPVGKITFFIIAWKFFGAKLWSVMAGTIIWIALGSIIWKSFANFHRPKRFLKKVDGKVKEYTWETYAWKSSDARVFSALAHGVFFIILSIVMMNVIL